MTKEFERLLQLSKNEREKLCNLCYAGLLIRLLVDCLPEIEQAVKDSEELKLLKAHIPVYVWKIEYDIFPMRAIHWEEIEAESEEIALAKFIAQKPNARLRKIWIK